MANMSKELLTMLFNHFYSCRWHLVGHVIRKAAERGIDCSNIPKTLNGKTIYGFFISTYPTLCPTMEKIDEYDLVTRLKMLNLVKKTVPVHNKKWEPNEKRRIIYNKHRYENYMSYKTIMSDAKKSTQVCAGVKVKVK
jgi:hypothetical protein